MCLNRRNWKTRQFKDININNNNYSKSVILYFSESTFSHTLLDCCWCSVTMLVWLFTIPWTAAHQAFLSFTVSQSFAQTDVHWVGDVIQPSYPLSPPSSPAFLASVLLIRWPKNWSFSISPSNEYVGLITFRIDWFVCLAVQGTLKSLLQHHSWKSLIVWHSAFFMVQLSHPYMTTGKTIALTIWNFLSKVMSLFFNTLSRFVIAFLPGSKRLNFMTAVTICSDSGAQENKNCHCFHFFPIYYPWSNDAMIFFFWMLSI